MGVSARGFSTLLASQNHASVQKYAELSERVTDRICPIWLKPCLCSCGLSCKRLGISAAQQSSNGRNGSGRPSIRSAQIEETILAQLRLGKSLVAICEAPELPCRDTVFAWIASDEERRAKKQVDVTEYLFSDRYRAAREIQAEAMADEILSIADDGRNDKFTDEKGNTLVDFDHIQRSKLRVDARKWVASKLLPKKYGDRPTELNVSTAVHNHFHLSESDLRQIQAERQRFLTMT